MSAHPIRNDFAQKVAATLAESWSAWNLRERESDAILLTPCETLDEVVVEALERGGWQSGDILAVQYSHAGRGKHTLWQFQIKQSTKVGTWRQSTNGGRTVFVGRMEPKLICQIALAAPFAPVLRFDAFRDGAVGRDLTLVEG